MAEGGNNKTESVISTFYRSEVMAYIELYIPLEAAKVMISEIGEIGLIQFVDLNKGLTAFQRQYVNEIRRFDELERILRFFRNQIKSESSIKAVKPTDNNPKFENIQEIDALEEKLQQLEKRIIEFNTSQETMNQGYIQLLQMKNVLNKVDAFLETNNFDNEAVKSVIDNENSVDITESNPASNPALAQPNNNNLSQNFRFVTGVIDRKKINSFERILWRALRGNLLFDSSEILEPSPLKSPDSDDPVYENVFIVFVHGVELVTKIKKICEAFGAIIYPVSENINKRSEDSKNVQSRISDIEKVLETTHETRIKELSDIMKSIDDWSILIRKEKYVYHQMNLFRLEQQSIICEGWAPLNKIETIRQALDEVKNSKNISVGAVISVKNTVRKPPTYNITNKFSKCFQSIVDSYGIATYREINPALYTIITFPFLFAVMFGDIGHGILMFLIALFMVVKEKKLCTIKNEIFSMLFTGRYVILLMGAFSIVTGFIYNDMFAKPLSIFSTDTWQYERKSIDSDGFSHEIGIIGKFEKVYPVGMDPAWLDAENKLLFINSYKMKMSIVLGVIHMIFGTLLSLFNFIHFKSVSKILCVFIPEMIFMCSIFGYLTFAIIFKWMTNWEGSNPPSLLNMLIFMFLSPGSVDSDEKLYDGQATVQLILLFAAVISVPWLLLTLPFTLKFQHRNDPKVEENKAENNDNEDGPKAFSFSDEFINRAVSTIEYCLSGISHTASYLRLWALSLAHGQLSEVLWDMLLNNAFNMENDVVRVFAVFGIFAAWFFLTIFILLLMEGLSAFLHALRLHWVEFNSKFFEGDGYKFTPFSFKKIIKKMRDEIGI